MNYTNLLIACSAATVVAAISTTATASIVEELTISSDGIPYRWLVEMTGDDTASLARHVGAWSWEDDTLFAPGSPNTVGWTHNADWVSLRLDTPVVLTIRLERKGDIALPTAPGNPVEFAGNNLFPGLTLWSGWDKDGEAIHSFNNKGDITWAEDLSYIGHQGPPTTGELETRHMIEASFPLAAGDYTFVFGGNSESVVAEGRQGYLATFTTTAVPEPGTALLALVGGLSLLGRRRRS